MTRDVVAVQGDTPCGAVVDDFGRLVGIVTRGDLLKVRRLNDAEDLRP